MIGNSVIMELIANGVQWYYLSYDHKKAIEDSDQRIPVWIPDWIKLKYPLWRIGKLRSMRFDPDGMIARMYIGRNHKYAKCFFPQEVGMSVKPILNSNTDKYNLIPAGLAIDENQIKL